MTVADPVTLIIPARFASTRFPGKPLAPLRDSSGAIKPLIQHSWHAAMRVPGVARCLVATDDERIAAAVRSFGGEAIMTPASCANGTERCAAAVRLLGVSAGIVINLQGDAPLTPAAALVELIALMRAAPEVAVATPRVRCTPAMAAVLLGEDRAGRAGGTTVVVDEAENALYFSKRVLPFAPMDKPAPPIDLHLGAYAYRRDALAAYAARPPSPLERHEGLEQLRFLHAGVRIRTVAVAPPPGGVWEVNHPHDVPLVEAGLIPA